MPRANGWHTVPLDEKVGGPGGFRRARPHPDLRAVRVLAEERRALRRLLDVLANLERLPADLQAAAALAAGEARPESSGSLTGAERFERLWPALALYYRVRSDRGHACCAKQADKAEAGAREAVADVLRALGLPLRSSLARIDDVPPCGSGRLRSVVQAREAAAGLLDVAADSDGVLRRERHKLGGPIRRAATVVHEAVNSGGATAVRMADALALADVLTPVFTDLLRKRLDRNSAQQKLRSELDAKGFACDEVEVSHMLLPATDDDIMRPSEDGEAKSIRALEGPREAALHVAAQVFGFEGHRAIRTMASGGANAVRAFVARPPSFEARARTMLGILGFEREDVDELASVLAGRWRDWRTRVASDRDTPVGRRADCCQGGRPGSSARSAHERDG